MALDTDQIAAEALVLLNEVGLEGLSTRRLAARLNVQGPALYKHFARKAEMLDYMAAALLNTAFAGLRRDVSWDDWLRGLSRASRQSVLRYRDGARLLVTTSPSLPRRSRLAASITEPLLANGFEHAAARHAIVVVSSFVEGWMLNEQNAATRLMMEKELGNLDTAFAQGVELILTGVAAGRRVDPPHLEAVIGHQVSAARG